MGKLRNSEVKLFMILLHGKLSELSDSCLNLFFFFLSDECMASHLGHLPSATHNFF